MKKMICTLVGALGFLTSTSHATKSVWVGVGLGLDNMNQKVSTLSDLLLGRDEIYTNNSLSQSAVTAVLKIGVGLKSYQRWHTGLEFNVGSSNFNQQSLSIAQDPGGLNQQPFSLVKVKAGFFFGSSLRLGYQCDKVLFFTKFGVVSRRFNVLYDVAEIGNPGTESTIVNKNKTSVGFAPGIGFEYFLTPSVKVGMETTAEMYRTQNYAGTSPDIGGTERNSSLKITPRNIKTLLTISYHGEE